MAKSNTGGINHAIDQAYRFLNKLPLPDLKRECLIRGLPFHELGDKSIPDLQGWFLKNFMNPLDHSLLNKYDAWAESYLKARGADPILYATAFRLGTIGDEGADGEVKKKRATTIIKPIKIKKERTEDGLFTGTKKAYTFLLQKQGLSKDETIKAVKLKFPEASEKSVSIWFNKAKKKCST